MTRITGWLCGLALLVILTLTVLAQETTEKSTSEQKPKQKPAVETIVYDVRDLLIMPPNFTGSPTFPGAAVSSSSFEGSALFSSGDNSPDRQERIEEITNLLQSVGESSEWEAFGGEVSSLRVLSDQITIRTTAENHKAIASLLKQMRAIASRQIAFDGYFIRMRTADLEKFKRDASDGSPILDKAAADKLVSLIAGEAKAGENPAAVIATCRIISTSGQRVYATSLKQDSFVSSVTPVMPAQAKAHAEGDESAASCDTPEGAVQRPAPPASVAPSENIELGVLNHGAILDVESLLTGDLKQVIVTVRAELAVADVAKIEGSKVEKPQVTQYTFRTTLHIPAGGGALLGGTMQTVREGKPVGDDEVVLLLRVRAIAEE